MNLFPANFHPFGNLSKPLFLLVGMGFAAVILGVVITRKLPRALAEFVTIVLVLGSIVLWGWLVFFRNIFPGI